MDPQWTHFKTSIFNSWKVGMCNLEKKFLLKLLFDNENARNADF